MSEGFITKIDSRKTQWGTYFDVYIDGKNMGGGKFPPKGVAEGDYVTYEAEKNSKGYDTIKAGSLAKAAQPAGVAAPVKPAPSTITMDKQDVISRQAALNSALAFMEILQAADAIPAGKTLSADKKADKYKAILLNYVAEFYKINTGSDYVLPEDTVGEVAGKWDEQE